MPNETNKNSMNLCRLILTDTHDNIKSYHVEQMDGLRMKDVEWIMNDIENMMLMMINRPDQSS